MSTAMDDMSNMAITWTITVGVLQLAGPMSMTLALRCQEAHLQLREQKETLLTVCCGPKRAAGSKVSARFPIVCVGSLPDSIHLRAP
jgi:hypothetical protein